MVGLAGARHGREAWQGPGHERQGWRRAPAVAGRQAGRHGGARSNGDGFLTATGGAGESPQPPRTSIPRHMRPALLTLLLPPCCAQASPGWDGGGGGFSARPRLNPRLAEVTAASLLPCLLKLPLLGLPARSSAPPSSPLHLFCLPIPSVLMHSFSVAPTSLLLTTNNFCKCTSPTDFTINKKLANFSDTIQATLL